MLHLTRSREHKQMSNRPTTGRGKEMLPPCGEPGEAIDAIPLEAASVRADKCSLQIAAPLWQTRQLLRVTPGLIT